MRLGRHDVGVAMRFQSFLMPKTTAGRNAYNHPEWCGHVFERALRWSN